MTLTQVRLRCLRAHALAIVLALTCLGPPVFQHWLQAGGLRSKLN